MNINNIIDLFHIIIKKMNINNYIDLSNIIIKVNINNKIDYSI